MNFQNAMSDAVEKTCPKKRERKNPWIDDTCWKLIEERRAARQRGMGSVEHKEARKKVKKASRKAKRKWYRDRLEEAEEAHQKGDSKSIYKAVKEDFKETRSKTWNWYQR